MVGGDERSSSQHQAGGSERTILSLIYRLEERAGALAGLPPNDIGD